MAGVSYELMFEVLKDMQARVERLDGKLDELLQEVRALQAEQACFLKEISDRRHGRGATIT